MADGIETWRGMAHPWNCDTMGHMNTRFYAAIYDDASFHFLMRYEACQASMCWVLCTQKCARVLKTGTTTGLATG